MLKLSVIVAIYNKENYIKKCVESIMNQTYPHLEILLVDDGSTDSTGEILDSYALRDKRIQVVHKENGGCTSARKRGLALHTGDAFTFVDGDDWLDLDMYEKMVGAMDDYGADIVSTSKMLRHAKVVTEDILKNYFIQGDVSICNKVFRSTKEMVDAFSYEGETNDVKCAFDFFKHARKVVIIPGALYNYRQDNISYCRCGFNLSSIDNVRFTTDIANETLSLSTDAYIHSYMHVIHAKFDVINKVANYGFDCEKQYIELYNRLKGEYIKDIRKHLFFILNTIYFSKNEKIQLCCLTVSYKLFIWLKKIYNNQQKKNPKIDAYKI